VIAARGGFFLPTMRTLPFILLAAFLAFAAMAEDTRVRVTKDHARLRYANADHVEIACLVAAGQELTVRGELEGYWVPVTPPDDVSVWIYSELVRKGVVLCDQAQLRAGPGLNYKVVGSVARNTPVESRGRLGDWLKIRTPPGFVLWVSRASIAVAPTSVPAIVPLPPAVASGLLAALTNAPTAATADTNAAITTGASAVEPPVLPTLVTGAVVAVTPPNGIAGLPLLARAPQGRRLRVTGTLRPSVPGATVTPARYRLSGLDSAGGMATFCHVLGAEEQLAQCTGSRLSIEGPAWWVRGESVPVLQAEAVTAEPQPAARGTGDDLP